MQGREGVSADCTAISQKLEYVCIKNLRILIILNVIVNHQDLFGDVIHENAPPSPLACSDWLREPRS